MYLFTTKTIVVSMNTKTCFKCGIEKPIDEFYLIHKRDNVWRHSYCKACNTADVRERKRLFKQKCINYLGGKCNICGYNKCISALDFHHIDRNDKEFQIGQVKTTTLSQTVKNELDKCMLLCSNCHRELHSTC